MSSDRQTGVVKFFNESKGYGFITPDAGGKDIFVHASALGKAGLDTLEDGAKVEFGTEPSKKEGRGPVAIDIAVLT